MKTMKKYFYLMPKNEFGRQNAAVYINEKSRPSEKVAEELKISGWHYWVWDCEYQTWMKMGWIGVQAMKEWIFIGRVG
jgi:hypothetical protein